MTDWTAAQNRLGIYADGDPGVITWVKAIHYVAGAITPLAAPLAFVVLGRTVSDPAKLLAALGDLTNGYAMADDPDAAVDMALAVEPEPDTAWANRAADLFA